MNPLTVTALSPLTLSAASALRPLQAPPAPAVQNGTGTTASTLTVQDLTRGLFQRTLQAATLAALTEPAAGSAGLATEAAASLLAALNAPQAPAEATAAPGATVNPTAATNSNAAALTTAPAPVTAAPEVAEPSLLQDGFATSLTPGFAEQTALRFGAGVTIQAAQAATTADFGTGLVRDATTIQGLDGLQPQSGRPDTEVFAQRQATITRTLRTYALNSVIAPAQDTSQIDLIA